MIHNKFIRDNTAVAGVIEALLLVALVAVILSVIQFSYVPVIMEQKESDHMDQVSNQFSQLKSVIEIQGMMGIMGTGQTATYTPMASPITLGSKELPYFVSARSSGQIDLTDKTDAGDYRIVTFTDSQLTIPLTSIKYTANNFYFPKGPIDQWQEYILEGGGLILKQSDGEVMRINPGIAVENYSELGYIKIKYFLPSFNGVAGKKYSSTDYRDCYIYTNYTSYYSKSGFASYIYIYTNYPDAWYDSLANESRGILREYCSAPNSYITVQLDDTVTPNRVKIIPFNKNIYIDINVAEIGVQIGPGYVP